MSRCERICVDPRTGEKRKCKAHSHIRRGTKVYCRRHDPLPDSPVFDLQDRFYALRRAEYAVIDVAIELCEKLSLAIEQLRREEGLHWPETVERPKRRRPR